MSFTGFNQNDFQTFTINGLEERMEAIRERIQPKFTQIGQELTDHLSATLGNEMFLHIARHARRSVNPPNDTWLAIAENKRGYKKHPHFQVGLFDDHVFIWLAFIYELPNKSKIANVLLDKYDELTKLPDTYVVSLDHMKKVAMPISDLTEDNIIRFRDVKKAEFLIGQHIASDDPILQDGKQFIKVCKETIDTLVPYYRLAVSTV
ncbi:YktB family protein [Radiobacillus sp. PE A8.2]|uniref:YktB family protein n=1 Tax=Radiobacillus sp. PE A8.2 TaxID=3380349 RepID=UPI00388F806B